MEIEITEQAIKEAREYEARILKKIAGFGQNYTGISQKDRYYYGYLGEWVFNEFLKKKEMKSVVTWDREIHELSDEGDFFFDAKIIDVKNATKPFYKNIMMPNQQFLRKKKDYYVAVRMIDETHAEVLGYVTYDDLLNTPIKDFGHGETKAILFTKLRKIDELLSQQIIKKWEKQND